MTELDTKNQLRKAGRDRRKQVPRASLAEWKPPADRRDPVQILIAQSANRVPELVPIRYARMLSSEFAFYRGGAAVMASDLSYTPNTGLTVQLAGDAHLANFGGYASPERQFVFDLNDFDETLPGPFEWDLKRLAASFAIAGRHRGFRATVRERIVSRLVQAYREQVQSFAGMPRLDVWYAHMTAQDVIDYWGASVEPKYGKRFAKEVAKAQSKTSQRAVAKLTTKGDDGEVRFVSNPPFLVPFAELIGDQRTENYKRALEKALVAYRRSLASDRRALFAGFRVVDLARKVVGVGSVGTHCWVALFRVGDDDDDVLMLQLKQAQDSVLAAYLPRSRQMNQGRRVVEGQRMMQAASDILLGWSELGTGDERLDFYVRQMWDWKESADLDTMDDVAMEVYAHMCGWTLARAHCRSGDRIALAGYLGNSDTLDKALAEYAEAYADQNAKDYQAFSDAASAGRITVAASGW